jgi:chemotaxis methyl-accepting protein methylase
MKDTIDLSHVRFSGATRSPASGRRNRIRFPSPTIDGENRQATRPSCALLNESLASILSHAGVNPLMYRPASLERRVPACLRALRAHSLAHAQERVQRHPELAAVAVDTLLLGVTSFFRDPEIFNYLGSTLLPKWHESRVRGAGPRILSIGCSDGHELYSMAIVLHQTGIWPPDLLLGMDCRPSAIARARRGVYAESEVRTLTPAHARYFEAAGDSKVQIIDSLRTLAQWQCGDLGRFRERCFDIVLFRNVSIYFEAAFGEQIWERTLALLNPGGLLVTGKAERPTPGRSLRRLHSCVYQKSACL